MSDETVETIPINATGITVSLLVWRRFKRPMPGMVERVYDLNPGLAEFSPFLPLGLAVNIPIPAPAPERDVTPVRLW